MRLIGKNFQSWEQFSLDISGLTVIVGPSNKGKSAIFRALKGLFRNELPAEYVRTGSSGLELSVEVDGRTVAASRAARGSTKYRIGDKEFAKLNQTIPPELRAFGMNEVEVGDFVIDPIFSRQNGKQFLIDPDTGQTELNTILGAFASTEKLEAGKKAANLEITRRNSEAKTLATEILESKNREAGLQDFEVASESVSAGLRARVPVIADLETKLEHLREAVRLHKVLQPLREILTSLQLPDVAAIGRTAIAYDYAAQATNNYRLSRFYKRTSEAAQAAQDALRETIQSHNAAVYLRETAALTPQVLNLRLLNAGLKASSHAAEGVLIDTTTLWQRIVSMQECLRAIPDLQRRREDIQQELSANTALISEVNAEISRLTQGLATCPKCGHQFDANHAECGTDLPEDYEVN